MRCRLVLEIRSKLGQINGYSADERSPNPADDCPAYESDAEHDDRPVPLMPSGDVACELDGHDDCAEPSESLIDPFWRWPPSATEDEKERADS